MAGLVRAFFVVGLLAVPLLVITELPRFFELASSVPVAPSAVTVATPRTALRLGDTPAGTKARVSAIDETPPPTLAAPVATATAVPTAGLKPTGERILIGNTGGVGAVLRSDPVTGRQVAALHEQQVLDVLERRSVPGSGDWVHVRTSDGQEGWVTALVALPADRR